MTSHRQDPPTNGLSLRWLNYISRCFTWLTAVITVVSVVFYTGQRFNEYGMMSLGNSFVSSCAIVAIGLIFGLCFIALTKLTELWAEIVDGGSHKTQLLESLLTNSGDGLIINPEEE